MIKKHKILLLGLMLVTSSFIFAQVRIVNNPQNRVALNSSAFLDASSIPEINNSSSLGKGILFPKTDLTTFRFSGNPVGIPNSYPTFFDGFVVYNTASSGTASTGSTYGGALSVGFWYYSNQSGRLDGGTWIKLVGSSVTPGDNAPVHNNPEDTNNPNNPKSPQSGDIYVDRLTGDVYTFTNNRWTNKSKVVSADANNVVKEGRDKLAFLDADAIKAASGVSRGSGAPSAGNPAGAEAGDLYVDEDTGDVYTRVGNQWKIKTKHPWYGTDNNQTATDNAEPIYVMSSWLGIGTNAGPTSNNERLFVNGGIRTTSNIYADYVFEEYLEGSSTLNSDYKFKSLKEVESFIKVNKHLPGVTGIKDLQKTELGYSYNLTELSIQSLEKIEELYLHVIEQQKIIEDLKIKNEALKVRLHKIETALGL